MMKTTAKTRRVRSNNREAQRVSPAPPTPGEYEAVENPLIWAPEDDLAALIAIELPMYVWRPWSTVGSCAFFV